MKALNLLLQQQENPLQLFRKLRQIKQKQESIDGIPVIESDQEEEPHHHFSHDLSIIQVQLQKFKEKKARQIANIHHRTQENIQLIAEKMKQQLQREALSIIRPAVPNRIQKKPTARKDMGSTLPGSVERSKSIETPGFDLPSSKSRSKDLTIDLREFTLGQRQAGSSNCSHRSWRDEGSEVSEFRVPSREPSSRRIKDKIMNSRKSRK